MFLSVHILDRDDPLISESVKRTFSSAPFSYSHPNITKFRSFTLKSIRDTVWRDRSLIPCGGRHLYRCLSKGGDRTRCGMAMSVQFYVKTTLSQTSIRGGNISPVNL